MKEGKSGGLLIVAAGLLIAAAFLTLKERDSGEAKGVDEAHNVDTDRDSWAQPMVQSIASQKRHSDDEKFEAWFRGLAEREQEWALKVAPEDSVIR